jgi:hypothetical protein
MNMWWESLSGKWSWDDPMIVLGLLSLAASALIPIVLWMLGKKQARRNDEFLASQASLAMRQRRDALLEIVAHSSDATYLGILWREIRESDKYEPEDQELLLARFRVNPVIALPGTSTGVRVQDDLTDAVVSDYVDGLERRYTERASEGFPYPGLLDFIKETKRCRAKIDVSRIVDLVTGPTAEKQRPGHVFFSNLVNILPEAASYLLRSVEDVDPRAPGGLRLNILTGTLRAVQEVEMERRKPKLSVENVEQLRERVAGALASLMHRGVLRSFDQWESKGSTESVSATVAWLVRAVGWVADTNEHLAMRMIENLSDTIQSIPNEDRGWGVDSPHVCQGFEWIREKQPELWKMYRQSLESAATEVGPWKGHDGGQ